MKKILIKFLSILLIISLVFCTNAFITIANENVQEEGSIENISEVEEIIEELVEEPKEEYEEKSEEEFADEFKEGSDEILEEGLEESFEEETVKEVGTPSEINDEQEEDEKEHKEEIIEEQYEEEPEEVEEIIATESEIDFDMKIVETPVVVGVPTEADLTLPASYFSNNSAIKTVEFYSKDTNKNFKYAPNDSAHCTQITAALYKYADASGENVAIYDSTASGKIYVIFESLFSHSNISPSTGNVSHLKEIIGLEVLDVSSTNTSARYAFSGLWKLEKGIKITDEVFSKITNIASMFQGVGRETSNGIEFIDLSGCTFNCMVSQSDLPFMYVKVNKFDLTYVTFTQYANTPPEFPKLFNGLTAVTIDMSHVRLENFTGTSLSHIGNGACVINFIMEGVEFPSTITSTAGSALFAFRPISNGPMQNNPFDIPVDQTVVEAVDISGCTFEGVTDVSNFFKGADRVVNINMEDATFGAVTDTSNMFEGCSSLKKIYVNDSFAMTDALTDTSGMFKGCSSLVDIDLSHFDTSNVTDMSDMFNGCNSLQKIYASDSFVTTKVTNSNNMFLDCVSVEGEYGSGYNSSYVGIECAGLDGGIIPYIPGYFSIKQWKGIDRSIGGDGIPSYDKNYSGGKGAGGGSGGGRLTPGGGTLLTQSVLDLTANSNKMANLRVTMWDKDTLTIYRNDNIYYDSSLKEFRYSDNTPVVSKWIGLSDGKYTKWYYSGNEGKLLTGIQNIDGGIYLFVKDGSMFTGGFTLGGNYFYFAAGEGPQHGKLTVVQ